MHPVFINVLEWKRGGYVEHNNDAVGSFVIGVGDGPEPFLARSIPDL